MFQLHWSCSPALAVCCSHTKMSQPYENFFWHFFATSCACCIVLLFCCLALFPCSLGLLVSLSCAVLFLTLVLSPHISPSFQQSRRVSCCWSWVGQRRTTRPVRSGVSCGRSSRPNRRSWSRGCVIFRWPTRTSNASSRPWGGYCTTQYMYK